MALSGIQFYLFYEGRYLRSRVDIGLFFAASVVLGMILLDDILKFKINGRMVVMVIFMVLLTLSPNWYKENKYDTTQVQANEEVAELTKLLSEDKNNLYLCSVGSVGGSYGVWDVIPCGRQSNICSLGGWRTYSPTATEVLNSYDVTNPFRDIVDASNVYLADRNTVDMITAYISRHYDEKAYSCLVKYVKGVSFYRIFSEEVSIDASSSIASPENLEVSFEVGQVQEMISVDGYVYIEGLNSYLGRAYAVLEDTDENQKCYPMTQYEKPEYTDDLHGQYSGYWLSEPIEKEYFSTIKIFYEYGESLYCVWEEEFNET